MTFFHKFVFAGIWSVGFGLVTVAMFFSTQPDAHAHRWPFVAAWIVGAAFTWVFSADVKRVKLSDRTLLISNYRDEIRVPVLDIVDVQQNRFISPRVITLTFKTETPFGRSIKFIPPVSFALFSEDDVVIRLRNMAPGGDGTA